MPWWVWLCIALFGVILLPAAVVSTRAVMRLARASGSLNSQVEARLARLQGQSDELNRLSARASQSAEFARARIDAARISFGRVETLSWAWNDVQALIDGIRGLVPRK